MEWYFGAMAVEGVAQWSLSQKQSALMQQEADATELQGKIAIEAANFEAQQARVQGHEEAAYIERQSERTTGKMAAAVGASGAELKGSPLTVIGDQIYRDQMAAATTISNSSAKARSIEAAGMAHAAGADMQAATLRTQAGITEEAGWLSLIATGVKAYGVYSAVTGGPAIGNSESPFGPDVGGPSPFLDSGTPGG